MDDNSTAMWTLEQLTLDHIHIEIYMEINIFIIYIYEDTHTTHNIY